MQRYRVNYTLLISLLVGAVVTAGALFGVWRYQLDRNAGALLEQSVKAEDEGNLREAAGNLYQYITMRREDADARVRLANLRFDIIEEGDDVSMRDYGFAMNDSELALRVAPDDHELRRKLIDLLLAGQQPKEALSHINVLLNADPSQTELKPMRVQCLAAIGQPKEAMKYAQQLVGYDPVTGQVDSKKAETPHEVSVYRLLAGLLKQDGQDAAVETVYDALVKQNPENADAYVARGQYFTTLAKTEQAAKDIAKALEIDPANVQANLAEFRIAITEERMDEAREVIARALKDHPEELVLYIASAQLKMQEQKYDEAIAEFDRGIEAIKDRSSLELVAQKARAQIDAGYLDAAKESIKKLEGESVNPAMLDFIKARLKMAEFEYYPASKEFVRLRPILSGNFDTSVQLNLLLGLCYEKMGQVELAKNAYDLALGIDPGNKPAQAGIARLEPQLAPSAGSEARGDTIYQLFEQELAKPEEKQNWNAFNKQVDAYAEKFDIEGANKLLLEAEFLLKRGEYDKAVAKARDAKELDPENLNVQRLVLRVVAVNPKFGPLEALKRLPLIVEKFKDQPLLRIDEADLRIAINDGDLPQQLMKLTEGIEDWSIAQRVQLLTEIATRLTQVGATAQATECWERVVETTPGDLKTLLQLFMTARASGDTKRMAETQEKILRVVGTKENATWLYTEASRIVSDVQRGDRKPEELSEAVRLINRARDFRKDWNQPVLLLAEVRMLQNNAIGGLEALEQAARLGPLNPLATVQYAQLLIQNGRYEDARKAMDNLPPAIRSRLVGRQYAEVLYNTGKVKTALAEAEKLAESNPDDADTQLWYGRFLYGAASAANSLDGDAPAPEVEAASDGPTAAQTAMLERAVAALKKAVQLEPLSPDAWMALVASYASQRDRDGAEQVIREARLALPEDQQGPLLAKSYEVVGRWFDAENLYKQMLDADPDNVALMRQLAQFYLGGNYRRDDKYAKAKPLINRVLKAGVDGSVEPSDVNLQWARRTGAGMLSLQGDYQSLLDAERLLASNAVGGRLSDADKVEMARILAPRPEPVSRLKAIALLEDVQKGRPLSPPLQLALAQLYFQTDQWEKCKQLMVDVTAANPKMAVARDAYIRMLLRHGTQEDIRDAGRQLERLRAIAGGSPSTMELIARVASAQGNEQEAAQALTDMTKPLANANPEQLKQAIPLVLRIAGLLTDLKDFKRADSIYQFAVAQDKENAQAALQYAIFIGKHIDHAKGMEQLVSFEGKFPDLARIQAALTILRNRPKVIAEQSSAVQSMLTRALREDPESISLLLAQADIYDMQQQRDQAAELYAKLLERKDLEGGMRAVVLNNLAYLLAQSSDSKSDAEQAKKYIDEAATLLGPQADILDTRGVVATALGDYDAAIRDLEYSVTDNPTASKYFHKADAHLRAGQNTSAVKAWEEAEKLGLSLDELPQVEHARFNEMRNKIDSLRARSAAR